VSGLFDTLSSLAGPSAYFVVAILAALEASAFVGLFVPGELAMVVGGYIAFEGRADLVPMMVAATFGAIVGDSAGYEIGRHLGPSMRRSRLGRKVGDERWERAERYLARRGGRAVFFGRFIGVLRALVPALAGASRMPYRKFLFWNALGAMLWAPSFVGLGFLAGRSYRRVEHFAGRAGLVLLALVVMVGVVAVVGRWVSTHQEQVRAFGRRVLDRPLIARFQRKYQAQLVFLARRLKPGQALGLALTLQLMALGLAGWAFGALVQDVLSGGGAARIDAPVTRAVLSRRVDWLSDVMTWVTGLGNAIVLGVAIIVIGLIARRLSGSWVPFFILGLAWVGGVVLGELVEPLIAQDRPSLGLLRKTEGAFPSGHATQAIAVYGALAYLAAGWLRTWSSKVAAWTLAILVVLLVGFSRIYRATHWTTDVLGGYALGALWLAAVLVTISAIQGVWRRRHASLLPEAGEPLAAEPARSGSGEV
jgi:undecaprenyl-diphosphatase